MQTESAPASAKVQALSRCTLFEGLGPDDLEPLAALVRAVTFKTGEIIFRKGDQNPSLYVIERGRVKISTGSAEGREVVLNLLGPPSVFGEVALFDGGERTADAIAAEPVTVLELLRRDLLPFLESRPDRMLRMLGAMTARLRWISERHEDAVFLELPARLAKRLLLLGEHFGFDTARGRRLTVSLPQRELASYMGVSRETVNRLLQDWMAKGLIEIDRGVLILKDQTALRRVAGVQAEV